MLQINYVSAPAGAGKTYELAKWTAERVALYDKIVIAQPTIDLMRETAKAITGMAPGIAIKVFWSASSRVNVTDLIQQHMTAAEPHQGEVMIISQEALHRMPPGYKQFWHLFVDESPAVYAENELSIPQTRHLVTTSTRLQEELIPGVGVMMRGSPLLDAIANSQDDGYKPFQPLAAAILDPAKLVLADPVQFNELVEAKKTAGKFSSHHIKIAEYLAAFASVTIMSANFMDAELYQFWNRLDSVTWAKHPIQLRIEAGTRFTGGVHTNGERLTISYLFDQDIGLKHLRNATPGEADSRFDQLCGVVNEHFDGHEFLWHVNKDYQLKAPFDHTGMLPMVSHGMNQSRWVVADRVVVLSVFNQSSVACKFLKKLGFDDYTMRVMLNYQKDYQTIMRCSLRDPAATKPVEVVVLSKGSAEYMQSKFPGSTIRRIDHTVEAPKSNGRPPKAEKKSRADIARDARARKKAEAGK